jgi:hypothetical protein
MYNTLQQIAVSAVIILLVFGGYVASGPSEAARDNGYNLILFAYVVYWLSRLLKYILGPNDAVDIIQYAKKHFPEAMPTSDFKTVGPIIYQDASEVYDRDPYWFELGQHTVKISRVGSRRKLISMLPIGDYGVEDYNGYRVEYLCIASKISGPTPHIFIDGRSQNRFGRYSRDMWSLHKRLSSNDKLSQLEGNFSNYFDVYSADKNAINALSIVTPDVMLQLRDHGFSFDYEIYDGHVYILHELSFHDGSVEYQAYFDAARACLDELVPQLTNRRYDRTPVLKLSNASLSFWAVAYSALIISIHLFKVIIAFILALLLGSAFHVIMTR